MLRIPTRRLHHCLPGPSYHLPAVVPTVALTSATTTSVYASYSTQQKTAQQKAAPSLFAPPPQPQTATPPPPPPTSTTTSTTTTAGDEVSDADRIVVKPEAFAEIKENGGGKFLRLHVDQGGCSGFSYEFEYDDKVEDYDVVFGSLDSAAVVIDDESLQYLAPGTEITLIDSFKKTGFTVGNNAAAAAQCGCNVSFTPLFLTKQKA